MDVMHKCIGRNITLKQDTKQVSVSIPAPEESFIDRRRFDKLLLSLSARSMGSASEELDRDIENGMKDVAEYFKVDRVILWKFSHDEQESRIMHFHSDVDSQAAVTTLDHKDLPYIMGHIHKREVVPISCIDDLPASADIDRQTMQQHGVKSLLAVPLFVGGVPRGALSLSFTRSEHKWSYGEIMQVQRIGNIMSHSLDRKKAEEELRKAYDEITHLRKQLEAENIYLRQEMNIGRELDQLIGQSDAMKYVSFRIQQVASTDSTVLITGETGTGKGMVARAIHQTGSRRNKLMVTVNCASLPANLIESELFGREKGAFTGAHAAQIGRFELADKGTIFLDEIGELPLELQAKLLRVIEDGEFERLGSPHSIKVDVRIIASTNRELSREIHEGRFREDLFYRLNVFPITVPPLRQRKEDIPLLVQYLVEKHMKRMGKHTASVPREAMNTLQKYPWPGNVRELENIIERSVIGTTGHVLRLADLVTAPSAEHLNSSDEDIAFTTASANLLNMEQSHILKTLEETGWRIEGVNGAAELLGLKPSTLRSRMKKLGIRKTPDHQPPLDISRKATSKATTYRG